MGPQLQVRYRYLRGDPEIHLGFDLRSALDPTGNGNRDPVHDLRQTELAQPALFAIEYALAKLWMRWGVQPQAMIGHSVGELVAACLAQVFSLEDALAIIAARGRLIQQLPPGVMLAVRLPEEQVVSMLGEDLSLAAMNAPSLCVVSGPGECDRETGSGAGAERSGRKATGHQPRLPFPDDGSGD